MQNPTEEKFRKIRKSNKAYQERVSSLEGTDLFLQSAGFLNTTDEGLLLRYSQKIFFEFFFFKAFLHTCVEP